MDRPKVVRITFASIRTNMENLSAGGTWLQRIGQPGGRDLNYSSKGGGKFRMYVVAENGNRGGGTILAIQSLLVFV